MARNDWSELDLRTRSTMGPYDDELICLYLIPKTRTYSGGCMVGRMKTEEGTTWFVRDSSLGVRDVAKMRRHYTIKWVHLPPTDR